MIGVIHHIMANGTNETSVFKLDPIALLKRFMILGSEKGTYYIAANTLTSKHVESLESLIADTSKHDAIISLIEEYNQKAFKVDYVIYVLARCCTEKNNAELRKKAYNLLNNVCKTPTHLFMFVEYYELLHKKLHGTTGWNKLQKRSISEWYLAKSWKDLAYLVTEYQNRKGWTHADILRLAHVKPGVDEEGYVKNCLFKYVTKGYDEFKAKASKLLLSSTPTSTNLNGLMTYLTSYKELIIGASSHIAVNHIKEHGFVREHVPTCLLNNTAVWNALLDKMPMIATLRNLNKLTAVGVFDTYPNTLEKLVSLLKNEEAIKKSRAHPMQFLIALKMYASGQGEKGKLTWNPNLAIVDALNVAFRLSFANAEPTNKRYLLALDVSGSMTYTSVCGTSCLMASEASCAMAMILAGTEQFCDIMGFNQTFTPLAILPQRSLEDNLHVIYESAFGSTDCSLPMTWALQKRNKYDAIIVFTDSFTDSETNSNTIRPVDALRQYNNEMGCACKLIVVAMAANQFSIADPDDPNMLDIAGFDASTPLCIREFVGV